MTVLAGALWAAAGATVAAVQARALLSQAARPRSHLTLVFARLVLVCTFAGVAVLARAPAAFAGWALGYAIAVATISRRLRRSP